jgi:hypothetical protein
MLFVSPIRLKPIDESAVSDSVRQILETLKASPRINRKELAEKLIAPEIELVEAEKTKLSLASDLHWMIREGHVIEFNDGSLDLPRAKPPKKEAGEGAAGPPQAATTSETPETLAGLAAAPAETAITDTEPAAASPVISSRVEAIPGETSS